VATAHFDRSNNFSISLHNVFDLITPRELPCNMPVLELVSPKMHVDVRPVEVTTLIQKSREVWENPLVTTDTESLLDSVEHNHMSPRELGKSPKESNVSGTHSSPLGREDLRPNRVEQNTQMSLVIPATDDVSKPLQDGVEQDHVSPQELEESPKGAREIVTRPSNVEHDDMQEFPADHEVDKVHDDHTATTMTSLQAANVPTVTTHEVVVMQRQEVHPSKNIQHGLDLWERVREYDARTTVEAAQSDTSLPILTRNQKQKIKVQQVMSKQPPKSRVRGDNKSIDQ